MYVVYESLSCSSETNIILFVNYISIKNDKRKQDYFKNVSTASSSSSHTTGFLSALLVTFRCSTSQFCKSYKNGYADKNWAM